MDKIKSYITPRNLLIFNLILLVLFLLFGCNAKVDIELIDSVTTIEPLINNKPTLEFTYTF